MGREIYQKQSINKQGKYAHFERQEQLRNLIGIKEKKNAEYLKRLKKNKSEQIQEKRFFITDKILKIQSKKQELLNNNKRSSIEKFDSIMKNEIETTRKEVIESARNKHEKRQKTIKYLLKKQRENEMKNFKLNEDNKAINQKLLNYNNMTEKSFNSKKNIVENKTIFARNDILKSMWKLKKAIISRNEREIEKGEDYFFTIANIKKAKITRRLLLQMHSDNLNSELEFKKDHAKQKLLYLETKRQIDIKRKEEEEQSKLERQRQEQLFQHSRSTIQLNRQAQEVNYQRIKNLRKFKRLKVMEKFEKLHQKNEFNRNFKIMKESRLLKLQFDSIRKKEDQIQSEVQKQKKMLMINLTSDRNAKKSQSIENHNQVDINEKLI